MQHLITCHFFFRLYSVSGHSKEQCSFFSSTIIDHHDDANICISLTPFPSHCNLHNGTEHQIQNLREQGCPRFTQTFTSPMVHTVGSPRLFSNFHHTLTSPRPSYLHLTQTSNHTIISPRPSYPHLTQSPNHTPTSPRPSYPHFTQRFCNTKRWKIILSRTFIRFQRFAGAH